MKMHFVKLWMFILTISTADLAYSQPSPITIDSLVVRALRSSAGPVHFGATVYLEPNEFALRIRDHVAYPYKLIWGKQLFKKARKNKDNSLELLRIAPKVISEDTIDINWGDVSFKARKGIFFWRGLHFRQELYSLSCGGTAGYKPNLRFVYHADSEKWRCIGEFSALGIAETQTTGEADPQ